MVNHPSLEHVLAQLGCLASLDALRPHWEESQAALAQLAGATPFFLRLPHIVTHRSWCGFGPEIDAELEQAAARIAADPMLLRLAWHCHELLFEHTDYAEMGKWPNLQGVLGRQHGVFYLLIALAMVPRVRAKHAQMGVPEEVTRATCLQVSCFAGNYHRMTGGELGIPLNQLYWLRHYPAGRLFRLGRFEYMLKPFSGQVEVYRHKATRRVLALSAPDVCYNSGGFVTEPGSPDSWTATLTHSPAAVTGYPVAPAGMAMRQLVTLPRAEWKCVLQKNDLILDMHIPAGGNMSLDRCEDSFRQAAAFFRRYFPETPASAIACSSWIFNTQLQQLKYSSDHLARFQRELYLFPVRSNGRDGLWFIFLQDSFEPSQLRRTTSLQRAVADFLAGGNTWRGGGMFYLLDDLPYFGQQYYFKQWPPVEL